VNGFALRISPFAHHLCSMSITYLTRRLRDELARRQQVGLLRQLTLPDADQADFTSNDYLGLARSEVLAVRIRVASDSLSRNGATGSRLLAGHSALADEVETYLSRFYQAEAALVFNSGYDANVGLLASLPQRGDTLLTDELIHASLIDGARLSYATRHRFAHNDLTDLEQKLQAAQTSDGQTFVVVESVYSMDGDEAPLPALAALCDHYGAALIVDEAHASGVYGAGLVVAHGLQERVFARVHTFGKALGVHGAAVVGPSLLRQYLINVARSFVYTTALPPHSLAAIHCAHEYLTNVPDKVDRLHQRIAFFRETALRLAPALPWLQSASPIQGLVVPGNEAVRAVARAAQAVGYDLRPIVSPTVPPGQERLRICLHSYNTETEIEGLIRLLASAN
jgi:8-amino-7-oxononanoate synthase